eukprot:m.135645 g.135645  ORF g.135645 m.135645 type:complete len:402 (-) comp13981_c1_seq1:113-1318(-)
MDSDAAALLVKQRMKEYKHILKNSGPKVRAKQQEHTICECEHPEDNSNSCVCGTPDCLNRAVNIECSPRTCPCEEFCRNQRFQNRQYANTSIQPAGDKGLGMYAKEDLDSGTFVIEYVGEIIASSKVPERLDSYASVGTLHLYLMELNADYTIDAGRQANRARFINHSCTPNCATQKWIVGNELRLGIFTTRPVSLGEEITINYNMTGPRSFPKCLCDNCLAQRAQDQPTPSTPSMQSPSSVASTLSNPTTARSRQASVASVEPVVKRGRGRPRRAKKPSATLGINPPQATSAKTQRTCFTPPYLTPAQYGVLSPSLRPSYDEVASLQYIPRAYEEALDRAYNLALHSGDVAAQHALDPDKWPEFCVAVEAPQRPTLYNLAQNSFHFHPTPHGYELQHTLE